jgi:hypothetical protein
MPWGDDDGRVDSLVLNVTLGVLACSFSIWAAISLALLFGRVRHDRRLGEAGEIELDPRTADRLVRRARRSPRTEWGRWRRIAALRQLERAHHPAVPGLVGPILADPDERIATAAIHTLGDVGDEWAVDILVDALKLGRGPRSRIAAELEELAPAPGPKLPPLLRDWNPAVRFWAATLLGRYPELAESSLIALTWDSDPNVRAAAVETLGTRSGDAAGSALVAALEDPEWFVRVHAARAAGHVVGAAAAPTIAHLLADTKWWVRTAAKDALRGIGVEAAPALLSMLGHEDAFARNGAAEVLQDIGFVDFLALDDPQSPLLAQIYAAGGDRLRAAAEARIADVPVVTPEEEQAA